MAKKDAVSKRLSDEIALAKRIKDAPSLSLLGLAGLRPDEKEELAPLWLSESLASSECRAKWPDRSSNAMQEPAVPEVALISGRDF